MKLNSVSCLDEIKKRRKILYLWIPIFFFSQGIIVLSLQETIGNIPKWFSVVMNIIGNGTVFILLVRISFVRCPKCGKSILGLGRMPFSLKNIRCRNCDYLISK